MCCFLGMRDQFSHPYTKTWIIIACIILICNYMNSKIKKSLGWMVADSSEFNNFIMNSMKLFKIVSKNCSSCIAYAFYPKSVILLRPLFSSRVLNSLVLLAKFLMILCLISFSPAKRKNMFWTMPFFPPLSKLTLCYVT